MMTLNVNAQSRILSAFRLFLLLFFVSFLTPSCSPGIMQNAASLSNLMELKNSAVSLMGKATGNFSDHKNDAMALKGLVNDQIDIEEARGKKNGEMVKMLQLLIKPDGNLLGGFLNKWESKGALNQELVTESSKLIGRQFDKIINLEKERPVGTN